MCHTVAEEGEVPFARIAGEYVREAVGDLPYGRDVLLLSCREPERNRLVIDVHIQRDEKIGWIRVLPYSQIHLAIVPDHPPPHHIDLLVRSLEVGFLAEDIRPELLVRNIRARRQQRGITL